MMKKTLLSLAALLLSSAWANAQIASLTPNGVGFERQMKEDTVLGKSVKKAAPKKALAENQAYLGPYTSDDLSDNGLGLTKLPGTIKVAAILPKGMLSPYKGAKVVAVRVGLCDSADDVVAFLAPIDSKSIGQNIFEQSIPSAKAGWNQANVATDYTIGDDELLLGFAYTQTSTGYPISINKDVAYDGGFYCYGNLGDGLGWYNMGTTYGSVSVQLIVEKEGGFSKLDGSVANLFIPAFIGTDGATSIYFNGSSNLGATFTDVVYGVKLNGAEIGTFSNISMDTEKKEDVTGTNQVFGGDITLPAANMKAVGEDNDITVYIKSIDGQTPENTDDDAVSSTFKVYSESVPHQKQIIEHFTSQYCTFCPLGINILESVAKKRGDIAWVSLHGDMTNGKDAYTIKDSQYYMSYAITGFPSATFNRYYLDPVFEGPNDGRLSFGLGYKASYASQVATLFSNIIDQSNSVIPAFTTVDIETTYDEASGKLGIKVNGKGVADVKKLIGEDAALTVYLTEDGIVAKQLNQGKWVTNFTHDNVLRKVVSAPFGDAVVWNGDDFEMNYEVTLNSTWDAKNMNVVAFVGRPIVYSSTEATPYNKAWINNGNSVGVGLSTGINGVADNGETMEVARYSLDGVKLSAPQKGLNIVKLSDGRTMKVMVK